ncbi:AmmeMemoRadiSam system protein A [Actinobaculum sp. 352]|uniref:AmmeMemoRadiSam system protein A n=1 Tax=Actinobaculum sp. 352 TaxID=2490946 RepID=UPI000F7DA0DE|nr:AmmeMemoRadiSam system protein A [Actinobaculum sp. 352]RTE49830.1 AmmeMemoRadiSam system protein A [Actinobaculum sp. 352]
MTDTIATGFDGAVLVRLAREEIESWLSLDESAVARGRAERAYGGVPSRAVHRTTSASDRSNAGSVNSVRDGTRSEPASRSIADSVDSVRDGTHDSVKVKASGALVDSVRDGTHRGQNDQAAETAKNACGVDVETDAETGDREAKDVELMRLYPRLAEPGATFVSLHKGTELRGCIGSLVAHQSLLGDVRRNAFMAAFSDPRFPPLQPDELADLHIEVSLLSPPERMLFLDRLDLEEQLRPGVDGLILEFARHRGTFLPQVWDQLPSPRDFVDHLLVKAGLPPSFWAPEIAVSRYTVTAWSEEPVGGA